MKLHSPEFRGGMEWLTFGPIRAVHWDTAIYGFGGLAASGTLLWLQARLCQVRLPYRNLLLVGGVVFNMGLVLGTAVILRVETLEFLLWAMPCLVVPYVFIV